MDALSTQIEDGDLASASVAVPIPSQSAMRRRVIALAWPVISENFLHTLLGIVDTLMVAQLGPAALAGVGAAIQLMFFVISALSALSVGSSVLVAQAVGGHRLADAGRYAKQSLVWSVLLSIPLVLVGLLLARPAVGIFGMEPAVTDIGAAYFQVVMGTVVVLTLQMLGGGVLRGAGDSRTPMLITLFANVINVVLTYGLIFGKLGMPELGAVGSAWGTFLSRLAGFALLFYIMWRGVNGVSIRGKEGWRPDLRQARRLLKIGVPAATEQVLNSVAFLFFSITVAQLGTLGLAAHRVALNALSISFLPGIGFALAATSLVGQSIGAQRPAEARAVAAIATRWAAVWMGTIGVVFLFSAETIIALFTPDPDVVRMGGAALRAIAFTQPFWAVNFVQSGALRGTGDTQYPMIVGVAGIWTAVALGALVLFTVGGGLTVSWGAFLLTSPITAYLFTRRFRRATDQPTVAVVG
jgi:multidrug resistance protein, MATE family